MIGKIGKDLSGKFKGNHKLKSKIIKVNVFFSKKNKEIYTFLITKLLKYTIYIVKTMN